jgi:pyruvate kinase
LAEENLDFSKKEIVIHPNETGIVQYLKKGNRVFIDDGVIKGEVEKVEEGRVKVRIVRISSEKSRIKSGKGLNFPDSVLQIPSLTTYDLSCLPFIVENADLVGYSFVRYASDVAQLMDYLAKYPDKKPDIIIKIETPEAVQNLPHLLLQGMKNQIFGVMIARGDLAVEIGFERTGEIQDEILWICEAAHVPVIWATQVLESLNKSGMATRSEITDAAHAGKAECIMINKGDYTLEVIETLKEIGARMGGHQVKKRFTFRPLNIARRFFNNR